MSCEHSKKQNCHTGKNDDKFVASCDTSSDETAATQCCAYKTPDSQSETSIFCYGKLFKAQFLQIIPSPNKTNSKKSNHTIFGLQYVHFLLVYSQYIFFCIFTSVLSVTLTQYLPLIFHTLYGLGV